MRCNFNGPRPRHTLAPNHLAPERCSRTSHLLRDPPPSPANHPTRYLLFFFAGGSNTLAPPSCGAHPSSTQPRHTTGNRRPDTVERQLRCAHPWRRSGGVRAAACRWVTRVRGRTSMLSASSRGIAFGRKRPGNSLDVIVTWIAGHPARHEQGVMARGSRSPRRRNTENLAHI